MHFNSAAVILLACLALTFQVSLPHSKTGRASVLYSFIVVFCRVFCGLNTLFKIPVVNYSANTVNRRTKPIRISGDSDNQRPDKWGSTVLHAVKEEKTFIHTDKRRKEKSTGHILCRICLLKHVIQ